VDDSEVEPITTLCAACFGDSYIRKVIDDRGTDEACSFGCDGAKSLSVGKIAWLIHSPPGCNEALRPCDRNQ
jgi:hypothetical protein